MNSSRERSRASKRLQMKSAVAQRTSSDSSANNDADAQKARHAQKAPVTYFRPAAAAGLSAGIERDLLQKLRWSGLHLARFEVVTQEQVQRGNQAAHGSHRLAPTSVDTPGGNL